MNDKKELLKAVNETIDRVCRDSFAEGIMEMSISIYAHASTGDLKHWICEQAADLIGIEFEEANKIIATKAWELLQSEEAARRESLQDSYTGMPD